MFGIGMQELVIIFVVALIFIGPQKLPEVARSVAKGLREFRRASDDLRQTIMIDLDDEPTARTPPPPRFGDLPKPAEDEQPTAIPGSLAAPEGTVARADGDDDDAHAGLPKAPSAADLDAALAKAKGDASADEKPDETVASAAPKKTTPSDDVKST